MDRNASNRLSVARSLCHYLAYAVGRPCAGIINFRRVYLRSQSPHFGLAHVPALISPKNLHFQRPFWNNSARSEIPRTPSPSSAATFFFVYHFLSPLFVRLTFSLLFSSVSCPSYRAAQSNISLLFAGVSLCESSDIYARGSVLAPIVSPSTRRDAPIETRPCKPAESTYCLVSLEYLSRRCRRQ